MKFHPLFALLLSVFAVSSRALGAVARDLTVNEFNEINLSLASADVNSLPKCNAPACPDNISHLIKSAAMRINWDLKSSIIEAKKCMALSQSDSSFTNYACARIMASDEYNIYGYSGYLSSLGVLSDATSRGYVEGVWRTLWKYEGNERDDPTIKWYNMISGVSLKRATITRSKSIVSSPLFGAGYFNRHYLDEYHALHGLMYPSVRIKVNGKDAVMYLDTGATRTYFRTGSAEKFGITKFDALSRVKFAGKEIDYGMVNSLVFSGVTMRNMIIGISGSHVPDGYDGVLGFDVIDKLDSFEMTKDAILANVPLPGGCDGKFTVSSDIYGGVAGIAAAGATFDGRPVVAVLDTGNSAVGAMPMRWFVSHRKVPATNVGKIIVSGANGSEVLDAVKISGEFKYLGWSYSGAMLASMTGSSLGRVDFNIGMPFFYGKKLYVSFKDMKMCVL